MSRLYSAEGLDTVEAQHKKWRASTAPQLSNRYVPGEGCTTGSPIAFIFGEAPGATEDIKLRPFVGQAGIILRELMAVAGLFTGFTPHFGQSNCWLTNVVKFRPPGNKTPDETMINQVRRLLRPEWEAVGKPQIIVPVGNVALQALLGRKVSILAVAGQLMTVQSEHYNEKHCVWPMVHPSFALHAKRGREAIQQQLENDWHQLGRWLLRNGHIDGIKS